MRLSRSFCLLLTEFFLSIRTEISVRSLPLCKILQIFTVNFPRYFRSKYKFCKILEGTRSLNLHLREPGVLARARAISDPGRARQETISSHLKHGACLYLKFEGLNLSIVIIFKTFHWLKNDESYSVVSVTLCMSLLLRQRKVILCCCETTFYCRAELQSHLPDNYLADSFDT